MNAEYHQAFYHIKLETRIDMTKLTERDFSKPVVHEYIHFLQDIFTTFGLARSAFFYKNIAYLYRLPKGTEVSLPIRMKELFGEKHVATMNERLFALYENRCDWKVYGTEIDEINRVNICSEDITVDTLRVRTYSIELGKYGRYPFGASCIYECMAWLFEELLFPSRVKRNVIPYCLPTIFLKDILGDKYSDKVAFCICCYSLMSYNPAELFFMIVDKIRRTGLEVNLISSIDSNVVVFENGREVKFDELYKKSWADARDSMENIFDVNMVESNDARDWALQWFDAVPDGYHFFDKLIPLFDLSDVEAKHQFWLIVSKMISPVITNQENQSVVLDSPYSKFHLTNSSNITFWLYIENMYQYVFCEKDSGCTICDMCYSQNNDEDVCLFHPLSGRLSEKPFCMLRQLWQMWGLYKFEVVKGNDRIGPLKQNLC